LGAQIGDQALAMSRGLLCLGVELVRPPDENALEVIVGRLLDRCEVTLAVAESCTGGLIGHRITNVPGSSAYYQGSVTAYAYDVKELILHVRHDTIRRHGAVSEQTALEMARGVRRAFRADVGLSVTGIAGPGGGMPGKPVGLVYIALAAPVGEWVERRVWDGNRWENKECSAEAALDLLRRYLEGRLQ
jgi:PncC family amidohydrolase